MPAQKYICPKNACRIVSQLTMLFFVKWIISEVHHPMYKVHVYQFSTKSVYRLVKTLHTNSFAKKS